MKKALFGTALFIATANALQIKTLPRYRQRTGVSSSSLQRASAPKLRYQRLPEIEPRKSHVDLKASTVDSFTSSKSAPSSAGGIDLTTIQGMVSTQALSLAGITLLTGVVTLVTHNSFALDAVHWNGVDTSFSSPWDLSVTLPRLSEGFLVASPLILADSVMHGSQHRDISQVNFVTTRK